MRLRDFQSLLSSIANLSLTNDQITFELINVIYSLVTNNESIVELFTETSFLEGLYSLLVLNNLSSETKEMILKLINVLLQSKRLSQPIRALLRLETNGIGFGGIISCLPMNELSPSIVNEILNIIISSSMPSKDFFLFLIFLFVCRFDTRCSAFKYRFNTFQCGFAGSSIHSDTKSNRFI